MSVGQPERTPGGRRFSKQPKFRGARRRELRACPSPSHLPGLDRSRTGDSHRVAGAPGPTRHQHAGRRHCHARSHCPLHFGSSHVPGSGHAHPRESPTTTIVRTGLYRFSRNPIYLAFSIFQLGLSLWVNSLGLLIALAPAVALMSLVVIPREERYLEARFPSEYVPYKASVRRWL